MHDTTVGKSKSVAPSTVEYQELEQGQPSPSTKQLVEEEKLPLYHIWSRRSLRKKPREENGLLHQHDLGKLVQ
jgi:hypothetical protein